MAAPKFGTLVPNRIFVGGISASTSEAELTQLFSAYGNVKATKIISDRAGVSKGYGFVTFETDEEARRLQQESECIILRERKLNIAPAIKKQSFNRLLESTAGSSPVLSNSTYYYTNGMGLMYQNGFACHTGAATSSAPGIPPTESGTIYQTTGMFDPQTTSGLHTFPQMMYTCGSPSLYMPQQFHYSPITYETYYTGASAASGLPQYALYATNVCTNPHEQQSQPGQHNCSTGCTIGNTTGPGTGSEANVANSRPFGPLPPPSSPFYIPSTSSSPPHHHPPIAPCPVPPPAQLDHLCYPFTSPGPPQPPHQIGIGDQQLVLYTTDPANCQKLPANNENQNTQEVQIFATGLQAQSRFPHQHSSHQQFGPRRFSGSFVTNRKFSGCSSQVHNSGEYLRRSKHSKVNGLSQGNSMTKVQEDQSLGGGGDATGSNMASMLPITPPPTPRTSTANASTAINSHTGNSDVSSISEVCHQIHALAL